MRLQKQTLVKTLMPNLIEILSVLWQIKHVDTGCTLPHFYAFTPHTCAKNAQNNSLFNKQVLLMFEPQFSQ